MKRITFLLLLLAGFSIGWIFFQRARKNTQVNGVPYATTRPKELVSDESFQNGVSQDLFKTTFFVVNGNSGINVPNPTYTVNGKTIIGTSDFLTYMRTLSNGIYNVDIAASGFKQLNRAEISVPENLGAMVVNMEPITKAHTCPKKPTNNIVFVLCGYVSDESHNALPGVYIVSPNFTSISVITSVDGYFKVEIFPKKNYGCGDFVTFTLSKQGYKKLNYLLDGSYVYKGGSVLIQFSLEKGVGTEQKKDKHEQCL